MASSHVQLSRNAHVPESVWMSVSRHDRAILASAYELGQYEVDRDATSVREWRGSDAELFGELQEPHGWTVASEYAPNYLAALRAALHAGA